MKTILLPTDFSDHAWNAIFTAIKLFHKEACRFILVHAYQSGLDSVTGDSGEQTMYAIYEKLGAAASEEMDATLGYLEREHTDPRHRFEGTCRPGELLHAVRGLLKTEPVDLIVMGTQGSTGAKRIFMGSNTVRLLRHIPSVPTLAVPGPYDLQQLKAIVLPTDYLRKIAPYELQPLLDILSIWRKARLHVVYASGEGSLSEKQERNQELLRERLGEVRTVFKEIPIDGNLSATLAGYAHRVRADLMALVHRRHPLLAKLIREPVLKRMAFSSEIPLLVLPERS